MEESPLDLAPTATLIYRGAFGDSPKRSIYFLDQSFAAAKIAYFAELDDFRFFPSFFVRVKTRDIERAMVEICRLMAARA